MAVKTITVTNEAYEALKTQKQPNESFSKTIIRVTRRRPLSDFFGILHGERGKKFKQSVEQLRKERVKRTNERLEQIRKTFGS